MIDIAARLVFVALVVSVLVTVSVIDLKHYVVPPQLVYPAIGAVLVATPFVGGPTLTEALLGGAIGLGLLLLAALFLGVGLGDAELTALIGLVVGFPLVLLALLFSFVFGGGVATVLLLTERKKMKDAIPFAPFLAAGAIVALLVGEIMCWNTVF